MTSGTVASLIVLLMSCSSALAQQQAQFNQVLNINGDMSLNAFQFQDGSRIETFSQKQQQIIVNQQTPSISPNSVTGTTGNPFIALTQNSMVINTNNATDLVGAQIIMAMNAQLLQQNQIDPGNVYVAMLSPDRQTWMIEEPIRSINGTDMTVRMVKRQALDGEYMILGRQTIETETVLTPFGSGQDTQVQITGSGLQENEFTDGFRLSVKATQPMTMNVNVKKGLDTSMLAALTGQQTVNDYRYSVSTSLGAIQPNLNQQVTVIQMPLNAARIQKMMQAAGIQADGQVMLGVAQRTVLQNPGGATAPLQGRGRLAFRSALGRRQDNPLGVVGSGTTGQDTTGATGQDTTGTAGQGTADQGNTGQGTAGTGIAGQGAAGQGVTGQVGQNGQNGQLGTPTNNNPVATQLLLAPTFTPVQADVVLDTANMRLAFPVSQLDGEYILTIQTGAARAQPPAGGAGEQQPAPAQSSESVKPPTAGGEAPKLETSSASSSGEEAKETAAPVPVGETPKPAAGSATNGTSTIAEPKVKREDANKEATPGKGQVLITMREVNRMVEMQTWGGQAPITEMMSNFQKASNGTAKAR